jgi:hypothetical protein
LLEHLVSLKLLLLDLWLATGFDGQPIIFYETRRAKAPKGILLNKRGVSSSATH